MKLCQYCNSEFAPRTFNQIYCTDSCTKHATNERVMRRYYERKENRRGRQRRCTHNGCDTLLSRYNDNERCSIHESPQLDISYIREWA